MAKKAVHKSVDKTKNQTKVWLVSIVSFVILVVAVVLLYSAFTGGAAGKATTTYEYTGGAAGKATTTPEKLLVYQPGKSLTQCTGARETYLKSTFKDLGGASVLNPEMGCFYTSGTVMAKFGCDGFSYEYCIKSKQAFNAGAIYDNSFLCLPNDFNCNPASNIFGATAWAKCTSNYPGLLNSKLINTTLGLKPDPYYNWIFDKMYLCTGTQWVRCKLKVTYNNQLYDVVENKRLCLNGYVCIGIVWEPESVVKIDNPNYSCDPQDHLWKVKSEKSPTKDNQPITVGSETSETSGETPAEVPAEKTVQKLLANYHFDGNTDDAVKPGFGANAYGTTYSGEGIGKSIKFAGTADSYAALSPLMLNNLDDFAVMFWMKAGAEEKGKALISVANVQEDNAFLVYDPTSLIVEAGKAKFEFKSNLADSKWHHVALNYKYTAHEIALYVDGQFVNVLSDGNMLPVGYLQDQKVQKLDRFVLAQELDLKKADGTCPEGQKANGNFCADPKQAYAGQIDELKFYNYALPSVEIVKNYGLEKQQVTTLTTVPIVTPTVPEVKKLTTPAVETNTPSIPAPTTCTDSDKGVDYLTKGTVVSKEFPEGKVDYCSPDGKTISEGSCGSDNNYRVTLKNCADVSANSICSDGACVKPGVTILGDADGNGCLTLNEYNDFKYQFKKGLHQFKKGLLHSVTLDQYNDVKYQFKKNLNHIVCP